MLSKLKSVCFSARNFTYHLLCRNQLFYQISSRRVGEEMLKLFADFTSDVEKALSQPSADSNSLKPVFADFFVLGDSIVIAIVELLWRKHSNSTINSDKYNSLFRELSAASKSTLSSDNWTLLGFILGCQGFFKLAYCCYNQALELALEQRSNKNNKELAKECLVLMESFNIDRAIKLFDTPKFSTMLSSKLRLRLVKEQRLYDVELFFSVLKSDRKKIRELSSLLFTEKEYAYLNYIEGKTVAVVGSAFTDDDNGEEIDSFDIVVRLNYTGRNQTHNDSKLGTKTNVVYYNTYSSRVIRDSKDRNFLRELDFCVLKSKNDTLISNKSDVPDVRERTNLALRYIHMLNGVPNLIPIIALDLLLFRPKKIKIFYTNFYSSKIMYRDDHIGRDSANYKQDFMYSLMEHDLISNLSLMRNLWRAGYYEPDNNMRQVLEFTNEEYMASLEDTYLSLPKNIL